MVVEYHIHNGEDSPQVNPLNLMGFPAFKVTNATTTPAFKGQNNTIIFQYDSTQYVEWIRINNTWVGVKLTTNP